MADLTPIYGGSGSEGDNSSTPSFRENRQFKIFKRFVSVPQLQQVVYKFTSTYPLNIIVRSINLYAGGREYVVYPDDDRNTFTGTLTSVTPAPVNGNLRVGLTEHPDSTVAVSFAQGADIFETTNIDGSNGDIALTDGNSNRANNSGESNSVMSGVGADETFWLVFNHIGANGTTSGQFLLQWEEIL